MISGVAMPDRLEMKLKVPPVSPISGLGAIWEISDQPMDAMPLPKKARHMKAITYSGRSTKFAPMMLEDKSRPKMMGVLRAAPNVRPLRKIRSDRKPESWVPMKAAMKGSET